MKKLRLAVAGVLAISLACAADLAKVSKNDFIRAKPFTNSAVVVSVKVGQSVNIQKREGSWYLITAGAKTGWAPMLSVRRTAPANTASAGSLSSTATGRSSTGGIVSTTGIRGLNEENLKTALFDENAVAAAEKNRVSIADAIAFAQAAGVQPHVIPSLSNALPTGGKK
jgi:uncharacterized protein YgiM (DUF1202 family)